MELFARDFDSKKNVLPYQGIVNYYGSIIPVCESNEHLNCLMQQIEWRNDEAVIFGKRIITKRQVAWYGDNNAEYTYSRTTKRALPWTPELIRLKELVESASSETFNSCLLNLYHTGDEGMAWHSDGEKDLKKNGAIGSLSFGAERKFMFRHKVTKETISIQLEH
jgi:alkylated DNA repair dioxygenase AlkB